MKNTKAYFAPLPRRIQQGGVIMEGFYEVLLNDAVAGKVQVTQEGLYYRVRCRCAVPDDGIYRLVAVSDHGKENLGVVVPENDGYILNRKIPAKNLPEGSSFALSADGGTDSHKFVPISPDEPFSYIDQLQSAFLEIREGNVGIRLENNSGAD